MNQMKTMVILVSCKRPRFKPRLTLKSTQHTLSHIYGYKKKRQSSLLAKGSFFSYRFVAFVKIPKAGFLLGSTVISALNRDNCSFLTTITSV